MTITQTTGVSTTLTASAAGLASAFAVATLTSEAAAATSATFYDSDVLENDAAEIWNEYEIQTPVGSSYAVENLSACQSLTGSIVAPVGQGGVGRVRVTDGVVSNIIKCDTTKRGGQSSREFVEYSEGSISRYLYDQVEMLFDATPDVDYYSAYNHATSTYTRNAACWAASIDLSCVAVASGDGSTWTRQRGGTLITPRHILIARHFAYGVGTQVRFSNAAGTVETRTVIGTSAATVAGDFWVCTLNAAVTVASPCPVAGSWITQGRAQLQNTVQYYCGGLAIHIDQNGKIYACHIGSPTGKIAAPTGTVAGIVDCDLVGWADHNNAVIPSEFTTLIHTPISGDSGQPVFVIIEGDPVLLWCWLFPTGGPPAYSANSEVLNALIAVADTNASIDTGLTVTVAPDPTL